VYPHHQHAIDRLIDQYREDPRFLAMLVGGSIAKGRAREDSDVDVNFIVSDEEFKLRQETTDLWFFDPDLGERPELYAEGMIISRQFLLDAIERGSEPTRASFKGAIIGFSHIDDLPELLSRVTQYPEAERDEKIGAFYAQMAIAHWFVHDAEARRDPYLASWAATEMVLYASRLVLAHNRILYPYHKWLGYEVAQAPERPERFIELAAELVATPTATTGQALMDSMHAFRDWGVPQAEITSRYARYNLLQWQEQRPALQDW
jgi:hypothetical protein